MANLSLSSTKKAATPQNNVDSGRIRTNIQRHWLEAANDPHHLMVMTPISVPVLNDKGETELDENGNVKEEMCMLPLDLHQFTSKGTQICLKSALLADPLEPSPECPWCLEYDKFDKKPDGDPKKKRNRAKPSLCMLTYIFNRVNTKGSFTNDNGEKVEFDRNPLCVIEVTRGTEDTNLESLLNAHNEGFITERVFEFMKYPKELKTPASLEYIPSDAKKKLKEIEKVFADRGGLSVPEDIKDFVNSKSPKEILGIILNAYITDSKIWENKNVKELVVKPVAINKEEKPETSPTDSGSNFADQVTS